MRTHTYTAKILAAAAAENRLKLRFVCVRNLWECRDIKGRVLWCGTLKDMQTLAKGGTL